MVHDTLVYARQRRALRRALRVRCQVVREHDFTLVGGEGLDLSPSGMLVRALRPVLTGEPVIVSFRLPLTDRWIDAEGTVARVVHGRRPGDTGRSLAVCFDGLKPHIEWFMRERLRGVPPPLPMREPRVDYAATVHLAALS